MTGNPNNDGGKQQGGDDRFDQAQEYLADNIQAQGNGWEIMSKLCPDDHADQYPGGKRSFEGGISNQHHEETPSRENQQ